MKVVETAAGEEGSGRRLEERKIVEAKRVGKGGGGVKVRGGENTQVKRI